MENASHAAAICSVPEVPRCCTLFEESPAEKRKKAPAAQDAVFASAYAVLPEGKIGGHYIFIIPQETSSSLLNQKPFGPKKARMVFDKKWFYGYFSWKSKA